MCKISADIAHLFLPGKPLDRGTVKSNGKATGRTAIVSHAFLEIFLDEDAIWLESRQARPTAVAATQMVIRQIVGPGIISLGDLSIRVERLNFEAYRESVEPLCPSPIIPAAQPLCNSTP